jgi:hypothetical protein
MLDRLRHKKTQGIGDALRAEIIKEKMILRIQEFPMSAVIP